MTYHANIFKRVVRETWCTFFQCDLSNTDEITKMFEWIENDSDLGRVDVCIANAGISTNSSLLEGK